MHKPRTFAGMSRSACKQSVGMCTTVDSVCLTSENVGQEDSGRLDGCCMTQKCGTIYFQYWSELIVSKPWIHVCSLSLFLSLFCRLPQRSLCVHTSCPHQCVNHILFNCVEKISQAPFDTRARINILNLQFYCL